MAATNPFTKNFDAIDKGTHDPSAPQENPFTPKQKQSSNPFTQNFGAIDETYRPRTLGENLGDIGRLWLQGQAGLGGNIGYGLQKTGIAPELGAKLRASGAAETKRLGANLTPQMQEAQAEPLINPEYKQGTEGGQFISHGYSGFTCSGIGYQRIRRTGSRTKTCANAIKNPISRGSFRRSRGKYK
jgi:hypothetical protein